MSTTLRQYQSEIRLLGRSIRKYIPLIATRTGYSPGLVTAYLDGYGSDVDKYRSITSVVQALLDENEQKAQALELEAKREMLEGKPVSRRRYNTRHL